MKYKNEKTRFFRAEHLIAIMLQTFRPKDKERIIKILDEAMIDRKYLGSILGRHGLRKKFNDFLVRYYEE